MNREQIRDTVEGLSGHYRSGSADLRRDFFEPCLQCCIAYRRAVGYFSSSALITWAKVLPRIAKVEEIEIQLLIGPILSEDDKAAIRRASTESKRTGICQRLADDMVLEAVRFSQDPGDRHLRLRLLAWLIASGRLELKFAFARHVEKPAIFHEKIGVFEFPWGVTVAFTGSANETSFGHSLNYETVDVFRDWVPEDRERVRVKVGQFEEAWDNSAAGLDVIPLSEAAMEQVRSVAPAECPTGIAEQPETYVTGETNKWRHQDEAIQEFLKQERGVLDMATGTGKTRTALRIIKLLHDREELSSIIVSTDGTDLLNQWYDRLLRLTTELNTPYAILRHYHKYHERESYSLRPERKILLISRPTLAPALRGLRKKVGQRTILIHDEVHRLGSLKNREELSGLSVQIRFRLGLSATPEREYDEEGTQFIENHVGPVIFEFGLADAIKRGILAPFNYFPLRYKPNEHDKQRIQKVYAKKAARKRQGDPMSDEEIAIEMSRIHKTSRAKLPLFEEFIEDRPELLKRCLVFVETREYGMEVLDIIHRHRHDFHKYFAAENSTVLERFARGELECLLTCHRLSEGIDIKNLKNVILFSSARARLETIQRMGRCLRTNPENPTKRANVVDFVRVSDPATEKQTADEERCEWLKELADVEPEE